MQQGKIIIEGQPLETHQDSVVKRGHVVFPCTVDGAGITHQDVDELFEFLFFFPIALNHTKETRSRHRCPSLV